MKPLLNNNDVKLIRSLPVPLLNNWVKEVYLSGYKDGIEKAESDFDEEAEIMSCEKVVEKLVRAGFTEEDANYILEVLLNE